MVPTNHRRRVGWLFVLSVLAWLGTAAWAPSASATTTLFNNNCSGCHGSTSGVAPYPSNTCAGCHAHGVHPNSDKNSINVSATPNSTSYNPGDPMTVSVTGGYRGGWVRVQMWGQNCGDANVSCNQGNALVSESLYTSGSTVTFPGPVVLNATAPATPGVYTWSAGWYGNEYDAVNASFAGIWIPDTTNGGHGNQMVTFSFMVEGAANTPPVANNDTTSTPANTAVDIDVLANDNDANGDTLVRGQHTPSDQWNGQLRYGRDNAHAAMHILAEHGLLRQRQLHVSRHRSHRSLPICDGVDPGWRQQPTGGDGAHAGSAGHPGAPSGTTSVPATDPAIAALAGLRLGD